MPTETTEFSFLDTQAAALGVAVPTVSRISLDLPDGRSLSALRFGDAAPVVTFLHGAGLNAYTWDATILALGLPTLAIDLAGHGDSSWRDDLDYTARPHAADAAAALEAWTDAPQVVVGPSLGDLTAARPDLVRAVIIVDITPGIDTSGGPATLRAFYGVTDFASRNEAVNHAPSFGLGGTRAWGLPQHPRVTGRPRGMEASPHPSDRARLRREGRRRRRRPRGSFCRRTAGTISPGSPRRSCSSAPSTVSFRRRTPQTSPAASPPPGSRSWMRRTTRRRPHRPRSPTSSGSISTRNFDPQHPEGSRD